MPLPEYSVYRKDFIGFVRDTFPSRYNSLYTWQREFLNELHEYLTCEEIEDNKAFALVGGKGVGKTEMELFPLLWGMLCFDGANLKLTAGKAIQTKDVILKRARELVIEYDLSEIIEVTAKSIKYKQKIHREKYGSEILIITFNKDDSAKIAGYHHKELNVCVLDEATTMPQEMFEQLYGMYASGRTVIIAAANPETPIKSFFSRLVTGKAVHTMDWSIRFLSFDDCDTLSEDTKRRQRMLYGGNDPDSPFFRSNYLGLYTEDIGNNDVFFIINQVSNIIQLSNLDPIFDPYRGSFGVDVAKGKGGHATVIVYRYMFSFFILEHSKYMDHVTLKAKLKSYSAQSNGAPIYIDDNGPGAAVLEDLVGVIPNIYGTRTTDRCFDGRCDDRRTQLYYFLSRLIKSKNQDVKIFIKPTMMSTRDALLLECPYIENGYTDNGKLIVERKQKNNYKSPDLLDALSYSLALFNEQTFNTLYTKLKLSANLSIPR